MNILPWYRLVGVAKNSSETQRRKSRAAQKKVRWPPRGTGTTVLTYPLKCAQVAGKTGENCQHSGEMGAVHLGQERRLLSVVTHSRL